MEDWGIQVLFQGVNMLWLFEGLLVSVKLALASMNLLTRMVKTTSLVVLVGVVEVVKVGKQILDASRFEVPTAAVWIYGTIFLMYFLICYPFSKMSAVLEKTSADIRGEDYE